MIQVWYVSMSSIATVIQTCSNFTPMKLFPHFLQVPTDRPHSAKQTRLVFRFYLGFLLETSVPQINRYINNLKFTMQSCKALKYLLCYVYIFKCFKLFKSLPK